LNDLNFLNELNGAPKKTTMSVTENIATFLSGCKPEDIPSAVIAPAKRHVIDTFGVAIGGTRAAPAKPLAQVFSRGKDGESFLWDGSGRTNAGDAAWINGTFAHALDFDDGGVALTPMHPSSPVLPAVWALCECADRSGQDALAAYILGLEVECKIASAISLEHYDHGWHATAVLGAIGAVTAASWLLGLTPEQIRTAIGIAASMTGGLRANFGTMTKPLHAGLAARNGIMAARLAQAGWSAHQSILETKKGFFHVFGCGRVGELKLGNPFHFESPGVSLKRFPSCSATHHCIEAMLALKQEHGLSADEIDSIHCGVNVISHQALRKEPQAATAEEARFSLHFTLSIILLEGSVELKHFAPTMLARDDVRALMQKVSVGVHPDLATLESKKRDFGEVAVTLKDGRKLSSRATRVRGRAPLFLSDADIDAKFLGCAEAALSAEKAHGLLAALRRLESQKRIRSLLPAAYGLGAGTSNDLISTYPC
jgi:2-methylcitrate dehydratase PrpD